MNTQIFLHGPVMGRTAKQLYEFALAESQLQIYDIAVISAMNGFPDADESYNSPARQKYLEERRLKVCSSALVLTLEQWEYDSATIADIKAARGEGIVVMKIDDFLERCKLGTHHETLKYITQPAH